MSNARHISDMKETQIAKAWVSFKGTGTVAINNSHNVTSVTDAGTGTYVINFTNSFPDTNYCFTLFGRDPDNTANVVNNPGCKASDNKSITQLTARYTYNSVNLDCPEYNFVAFD